MIDTTAQAAVVGGSLIAFAGDLPESHREDIYLSTLYAQRATRAAVADGLEGDWFEYYRNTLKFIGWDVPKPARLPGTSADTMSQLAIQQISNRLGAVFSSPISRAIDALERNSQALELFESSSLNQEVGVFQLIPCIANGPNKIDLGLYHRQFRLSAFFKVVVVSPVLLGDLHDNCQLPFGVEIHRPDRVPVACLT